VDFSITINFLIIKGGVEECLQTLRMYADTGFKRLDALFCGGPLDGSILMRHDYEDIIRKIKQEADNLGISFVQSHLPFANIANFPEDSTGNSSSFESFNEAVRRSITASGILGVPWAAAHPGTAALYSDSKKANLKYYAPFIELAGKRKLGIAMENLFDGCNGKGRAYCSDASELTDLVDELRRVTGCDTGICWDFGHGNIMYENQADVFPSLGNRLKMTHIHDNNGTHDSHLPPFYGTADWAENVRALKQMGYEGAFNFEVTPKAYTRTVKLRMSELSYLKTLGEHLLDLF